MCGVHVVGECRRCANGWSGILRQDDKVLCACVCVCVCVCVWMGACVCVGCEIGTLVAGWCHNYHN